jgi:putative ATP-binding cassette transporter
MSYEKMQAQMGALMVINNDMSRLVSWGMGGMAYKLGHVVAAGDIITYANLFDKLRDSIAWPMTISQSVFKIQTRANLLTNFAQQIELSKDPQQYYNLHGKNANIAVKEDDSEAIVLRDVALTNSIHEEPLLRIPSLEIRKGDRILLTGQSGSGKSLLIRAMGGLWKHGDGDITLPQGQSRMFVPQVAYVMNNMTLKENIIYPDCDPAKYKDEDVIAALRLAELDYLVPRLNDRDPAATTWGDLSVGEKQRLIFARIFLHKPDTVFLDEATSGLDARLQDLMYKRLNEVLPDATIVSIAHRDGLMPYHSRHLEVANGTLHDRTQRMVLPTHHTSVSPKHP